MQRQARETGIALAPRGWGRLLAYGVPLIGSGLASFVLGTADRWLLAGVVPAAALGQYALAAKIALIAALLTQPFELWWYPRRLALLSAPGGLEKSARIVAAGLVLTILAAGATSVVGPLLIRLLTPVSYHAAAAFIPWIAAAIALQSMGSLVNVGCYTGRTGAQPMLVNGIAALVALVLYLALIPNHGVAGAVGATVLAQAVRFALFAVLSQRRVRLPWRPWTMLAPIAMSSAAAWVAQVEPGLAGGAACMALLTTGALAAAACGVFPTAWATRKLGRMAHV
jgi:O-antigen/teichoic acid export membrane protein